ncbi:hypothetical protein [Janthinobacterium sp. SUN206]|uniref:hypothetical protein n=1 Tax=Janthinobacterium sp. SUN206 TaxID=3014787 RepID=UPI00271432E7|nr:hypothetical protein [Janthinobacterium sp. SUN206]MDO8065348.1 hypothetical protein [Janthinobacterium sp. SUN206]
MISSPLLIVKIIQFISPRCTIAHAINIAGAVRSLCARLNFKSAVSVAVIGAPAAVGAIGTTRRLFIADARKRICASLPRKKTICTPCKYRRHTLIETDSLSPSMLR